MSRTCPPTPAKVSNAASFDVWKGHFSSLYWSDQQAADGLFATSADGTLYKVSRGRATTDPSYATYGSVGASIFNPASDQIVGGEGLNGNMGFWDRPTVDAPNFGTLDVGKSTEGSRDDDNGGERKMLHCRAFCTAPFF